MHPRIEYYYTVLSTWTYLGSRAFEALVERHSAEVQHYPVDLRAGWRACGGLPVAERPPQRRAYRLIEMQRWRDVRGMPINLRPRFFPANPATGDRMVIAAQSAGLDATRLAHALLSAVWAEDRDVADRATLAAIAHENGMDGESLLCAAASEAVKNEYAANTQRAIDTQVFGFPSYRLRDELFWGQDRLDLLERAIERRSDAITHADLGPV